MIIISEIIFSFLAILVSVIFNFKINKRKFESIEKLQIKQHDYEQKIKNQVDATKEMEKRYEFKLKELEKDFKNQVDATKEMEKRYELELEKLRLNNQNELNPNELIKNPDIIKNIGEILNIKKNLEIK